MLECLSMSTLSGAIIAMKILSSAFVEGGEIPVTFTCEEKDVSPPLEWRDVPSNAKSLVLIVDDPDAPDPAAPKMVWVHWVLYNIDPASKGLVENITDQNLPKGTLKGTNSWEKHQYGGPCPPIGRHRYFHKLYALDTVLPNLNYPTVEALKSAMRNHVIAESVLMGTYQKKKK